MEIVRKWSMPNKKTFDILPIKNLILEEMSKMGENKIWIDPFANGSKLANITNDLNPNYDTTYHMEAIEFLKMFKDEEIDGVLFDPPYSPRQMKECYNGCNIKTTKEMFQADFYSKLKNEISRILKKDGIVISCCWNRGGMGKNYGFEIQKILLVPHGGWHNDTICTVDKKVGNKKDKKKKTN